MISLRISDGPVSGRGVCLQVSSQVRLEPYIWLACVQPPDKKNYRGPVSSKSGILLCLPSTEWGSFRVNWSSSRARNFNKLVHKSNKAAFGRLHVQSWKCLLAPTGALIVIVVFYISAAAATFSDFHSVH